MVVFGCGLVCRFFCFMLLPLVVKRWLVVCVDVARCGCLDVSLIGRCRSVYVVSCSLWRVGSLSRRFLVLFGVLFACGCSLVFFVSVIVLVR